MTGDLHSVAGWIAPGITAGPTQRPVDGHNLNNHALLARALRVARDHPGSPLPPERAGGRNRPGASALEEHHRDGAGRLAFVLGEPGLLILLTFPDRLTLVVVE